MMTQKLYFGQFSGDDYPTLKDWDYEYCNALHDDNLFEVLQVFRKYYLDFRFLSMLNRYELEEFTDQMIVNAQFAREALKEQQS